MTMESLRERLATTAVIYFLFLQLAIRFGIFGPTILDLMHHLNVTQQEMSYVFSVASVGVCVGAISSGFLFKYVAKQIGMASLLVVLGITVSFVTLIPDFYIFLVLQFIIGVTSGAAISGCEAWVLEIWAESCPPYMQALQFFRGLGYILGPIIVTPFLAPEVESTDTTRSSTITSLGDVTEATMNTTSNMTSNSTESTDGDNGIVTNIYIPYILNGLMLLLGAILVFFQYVYTLRKKRSANMNTCSSQATMVTISTLTLDKETLNNEKLALDTIESQSKRVVPKLYTYSLIFLCSVFYLFFYEEVLVTYLASFSKNIDLHLSKSEGAFLTSMFNLSNVIGKALSIVLALKLKHFTMLYINLAVIVISLIILMIFSNTSLTMLWVGVCLNGVGLSSIIASLYSLMESALTMDSMVCGILNMSGTLGSVFVPLAIANYIEETPLSLIYATLFCAVSCVAILLTIHFLIFYHKKKLHIEIMENKPDRKF